MGMALAAPMGVAERDDGPDATVAASPPEPTDRHLDVLGWVHREATTTMLRAQTEDDRTALLREGWHLRAPTWIQSTSAVNLGDFPMLDDPTARAERDLKTLEWVIEDNRRLAAGKPTQADDSEAQAAEPTRLDHWLRRLIPRQWILHLKAHREWVAAGGTALLIIVWATASFASRRSDPAAPAPPVERPRRRRRGRHHSTASPSSTLSGALAGTPESPRRARHSHR